MLKKVALALGLVVAPSAAQAFCGFYVASGDQQMFDDATQVVLMRDGTRTVLSMQNDYRGPLTDFAMVVPVPTVLHDGDVKTLPREVFDHVEKMGAPRLVEYWEQDPCARPRDEDMDMAMATGVAMPVAPAPQQAQNLGVTIEAKFVVGEYQVVILSATDSTGLDTWLRQEHYQIPAGAEPLLRPYVESGMKFFVAKVDPQKVHVVDGHAELSPLRFFYDSDEFTLPIRLGLANSAGTQDLIVNIFAPHQRYEVANYPNVTIPTNLDVDDSVRDKFGAFYAALYDATLAKNPGAVVTEYAWQAGSCDPCPGPTLQPGELQTLGADVLPSKTGVWDLVMTRLHARYGKDITNDLVFEQADAILGGREDVAAVATAMPSSNNNFQARYTIRHAWTGPIQCTSPRRGIWGGPPRGHDYAPPEAATKLAFAPRDQIALPEVVQRDVPEIGLVSKKRGCGCQTNDSSGLAVVLGALVLAARPRRRRRR